MSKLQGIRKEYGSFRKAIEYYAGMGCSRTLTAHQLDLDRGTLRGLLKHHNLDGLFKPRTQMVPECRTGNPNIAEQNKARSIPKDELLKQVAKYENIREFESLSPYSTTPIYKRFGSWGNAKRQAEKTLQNSA